MIGRGSGGVVYRALDRETGVEVALKTFAGRDPESLYRLKQEFRSCAGIRHRNLVELYELHVSDDDSFFTMELVDGVDVVRHVRGGFAPDESVMLVRFLAAARQLVQGLAALHAAGKLHRDVKPANALIDTSGRMVLLDFGFMVSFGSRVLAVEQSDTIAGSLAYMAPEILWGQAASPASDWYGAGVVFHEALSGELPFDGPPARMLSRSVQQPPKPLSSTVPTALRELIAGLLSIEPEQRPGAEEIARIIDTCSAEQRASAAPPSPLAEELPFVGREPELARLRGVLDDLGTGRSTVVHIRGASGIGKSELVRRFLGSVEREDEVVVLRGRCHPYEAVPYRAFDGLVDSLSRYLTSLPDVAAQSLVPRHASAMLRLFPVLGRVPALSAWQQADGESGDAQEQRRRGFTALRELLARLGDRRRLLLWIDDVQWTDPDSAALARELLGGSDPPRALVLLTYRSEDRAAADAFIAFERGNAAPHTFATVAIDVAPLDVAEARALAERFAGGGLADVSAVVDEAAGSPFFLAQLVRHELSARARGVEALGGLPQVLQQRLDELGTGARSLLEIVAVAGRPLEPRVALTAASLSSIARREVINLQEERLLRLAATAHGAIEVYHDRIREAVIAGLQPGALRERHRGLAHTLVREASPDAQALYRHFLGAGETAPAADWAAEAAGRADRALAFTEAADLYRAALELRDVADGRHWTLQERRATALVNAGRGAEAAPLFLAAAEQASGMGGLDLRRRAAEQYLQTGRIDDGVTCMQVLLRDLDLSYPRSGPRAALSTVARLSAIALRGVRTAPFAKETAPRDALRIETSRSAAKGLAMVDPFRALYFAALALALALRSGDSRWIARELAGVGATLLPAGGVAARWATTLLDRSRAMAEELDDPYLLGFTAITLAQKSMVAARWREMLNLCDEGVGILRDRCQGISWEVSIGSGAAERALEELGEVATMTKRVESALREAEDADDMYRAISALENIALGRIAQDRIPEARDAIQRAQTRGAPQGFHMQHFYMARVEAYCDLGEGNSRSALDRVNGMWPALRRSNLLRHALVRTDAHLLRARVTLAAGLASPENRETFLRTAARDARVLERQGRPDALAHAKTVRAALAAQRGNRQEAIALLETALGRYDRAGMQMCRGLTQIRLGSLIGAERSSTLLTQARCDLIALGVANVERLGQIYVAGI